VLEKQLLERLITERVLLQYAKDTAFASTTPRSSARLSRIAEDNKLSHEDFRKAVEREGIPFAKYRSDIRNEITCSGCASARSKGRVSVSDAEVDHCSPRRKRRPAARSSTARAHSRLVPEQASPDQIDVRQRRAETALSQVRAGTDFSQVAAGFSDAPDALQGGSLGWRTPARLPTVSPIRCAA
jgi:peptidyl-prolyl cis-trans isomerase SurA